MKNTKKKIIALITLALLVLTSLVSCSGTGDTDTTDDKGNTTSSAMTGSISVISREDGSGTRGAFTELLKVTNENGDDATVDSAEITNSTSVMMTTVAGNKQAIGYVSLGSLSDDVKAVKVDGTEATVENIKSGTYKVARPFNLVYTESKVSDLVKDFVSYIMSSDGQKIITDNGYISADNADAYKASSGLNGTITLAGSTSVGPVMEKLAEAYMGINSKVKVEITQSGSSAGITSAIEGACDLGMSSRELKDEEAAKIDAKQIAMDGIAVIINKSNATDNLTSEQIQKIFLGDITTWDEVAK